MAEIEVCPLEELPESLLPYIGTGNAHAILSGRVSYALGFMGPSLVVDTALQ